MRKNKYSSIMTGVICAAVNGLFGSGGGVIAVPLLKRNGLDEKKAHATSLALMLPFSAISAAVYFANGSLELEGAARYLPCGMAGVYIGSRLMKKISQKTLKRLFGAVMIYFGMKMMMR